MPVNTNIIPIIGIKRLFDENMLIEPINPPRESEPVSPINIFAFEELNIKNPNKPPTNAQLSVCKLKYSSVFKYIYSKVFNCKPIKIVKIIKYTLLTLLAKPSRPSVKFTQFVIAIKINATKGMVKMPKSIFS